MAEANSHKAKASYHEAEAKIALFFFSQILHFGPIFSKKAEIFSRFLTGLQKFWLQTSFNM